MYKILPTLPALPATQARRAARAYFFIAPSTVPSVPEAWLRSLPRA
jgi:hypothetical protein